MWYSLETVVAWAKRRWFAYPWSDIYGWLANAWDLWPYGVELQKNIQDNRWNFFVRSRQDIIGLDSQILMNPKVWEASGHVGGFSDPLVDCKKCNSRFRADQMIEEYIKNNFSVTIMKNDKPELAEELTTKIIKWKWKKDIKELLEKYNEEFAIPEARSFKKQAEVLSWENIKCKCWKCDWTEPKSFNLMFKTEQWTIEWEWKDIYLRPETAQWIFVNFRNILDTTRNKIPFGIAQIWKAFRNEITPGNFMFRVMEFYQMEIEFFCENDEKEWLKRFEYRKAESKKRREDEIGITPEKLQFRDHDKDELSFYSKGTCDVEYEFPRWWGELQGIAYRTDYDLKQHVEHSGKDMQYSDPSTGKRYIPHVVEPSWGLTRAVLTAMIDSYGEEKYVDGKWNEATRIVAKFHKNIAPIKFAILPLIKKDEAQVKIAKDIFAKLAKRYNCEYDEAWAIGKRYRRQDEIGTPFCVTVDHQSCEDGTVTIRDRDTMEQKRVKVEELESFMD